MPLKRFKKVNELMSIVFVTKYSSLQLTVFNKELGIACAQTKLNSDQSLVIVCTQATGVERYYLRA